MLLKTVLSILIASLVLFFWSGLTPVLPWGVPTAQAISTQADGPIEAFDAPQLVTLPANSLTTAEFDQQMVGKVSTLMTDGSFSWIISKESDYYNATTYLAKEYLTQLLAAIFLVLILSLTRPLAKGQRIGLAALIGVLASISAYGQLLNWWGLPVGYTLGISFNLIVGYVLASAVVVQWLLPSDQRYRSSAAQV